MGDVEAAVRELGAYRLMRSDLVLAADWLDEGGLGEIERFARAPVVRFTLRPEPAEPLPDAARIALFTTAVGPWEGLDPVVASANLARRSSLAADLARARDERCDLYLTELKAAAIDTVAMEARRAGARVVFVRNRPVGLDADLDAQLLSLHDDA